MKSNKGFTLIELVIVIIVLGILAAIAIPKFINLQNDANTAILNGTKGAMLNAIDLSYSKLAVDGLENNKALDSTKDKKLAMWCTDCQFQYGYPNETHSQTWESIIDGVGESVNNLGDDEIVFAYKAYYTGGPFYTIFTLASMLNQWKEFTSDNCYIEYKYSGIKGDQPTVELFECE